MLLFCGIGSRDFLFVSILIQRENGVIKKEAKVLIGNKRSMAISVYGLKSQDDKISMIPIYLLKTI